MIKNMTQGSPVRLIVGFALPMLIGNIFQQVYNLVDAAIVGRFVGADALAAVGSAGSTVFLLISLVMGLTNGASIVIGQYFGSGKHSDMRRAVTALIYIDGGMTVFISVVGTILAGPLLQLLNTPPEIIGEALNYLRILFIGSVGLTVYNACSAVLRSMGDSKTPLYMLMISSLVNVGLDLLFVIRFHLGVEGAAYATVTAQLISAALCLLYIIKHRKALYLEKIPKTADKQMVTRIFKMGIPTALQSSLIAIGGMSVQRLVNSFGTVTVAAYTAANKIDSMAIQPVVSIGTAMSVFTSQNIGAGNLHRIKHGLKQTLLVMVGLCSVIAVVIVSCRTQLLSVFLDKNAAGQSVAIGSVYLSIIGIAYVIAGIMQSFLNVLRGSGDVNFSMIAGIVELSTRIVAAYLLAYFLNSSTGIWIATPIAWGAACTITVVRYLSGKWKTKCVLK